MTDMHISINANPQEHLCKSLNFGIFANHSAMESLEDDRQFMQALVKWSKLPPAQVAKRAGLAATTVLRPHQGTASTRIGRSTMEKLKRAFPEFPGFRNESTDHISMIGPRPDPNEKPDELIYIREVDISYAMGAGAEISEYPSAALIPFNLNFIRFLTAAAAEHLFIATGQGESMEPTLLRSDMVMIDTSVTRMAFQDAIWALSYAGAGMIKRLRRIKIGGEEKVEIISDNAVVPPVVADPEDLHIIGKVVWVGRRL